MAGYELECESIWELGQLDITVLRQTCEKSHDGPRDQLLGKLSYEFTRHLVLTERNTSAGPLVPGFEST